MNFNLEELANQRIYTKTIFSWNDVDILWFGDFDNGKRGCLNKSEALIAEKNWLLTHEIL